jgi:hypothetical protein
VTVVRSNVVVPAAAGSKRAGGTDQTMEGKAAKDADSESK